MSNILSATVRLLETNDPKDITLRDVARESGHGPRLCIEWFGGKGGLFVAVFEKILDDIRESGEFFYSDFATRKDVRLAMLLGSYVQLHHRDFFEQIKGRFGISIVKERLISRGLSAEQADLAARRIGVHVAGVVLFRDFVGLSDEEVIQMTKDEFRTTTGFDLPDNPRRMANEQ